MFCKFIKCLALLLSILGALNWGLFGLIQVDLVAFFLNGPTSFWSRITYTIIGIAGLICLFSIGSFCKKCSTSCSSGNQE